MSNVAYIVKESGVTLFKDGKQFSAPSDFWSYDRIINKIKTKDFDGIEALFNARDAMVEVQKEIARDIIDEASDVRIANGEVYIGERISIKSSRPFLTVRGNSIRSHSFRVFEIPLSEPERISTPSLKVMLCAL